MIKPMRMRMLMVICLMASIPAAAQFSNLKTTLQQPRNASVVVVPNVPITGFDFDWADVPGATSYQLEMTRSLEGGGSEVISVTSTLSRILYSSSTKPLVPGTPESPTNYSWKVTAYQGATPSKASDASSFSLISGTIHDPEKPSAGVNPPATPTNLKPTLDMEFTPSMINRNGLLMEWDAVGGATGYEIQLWRYKNEADQPVENLIYRMDTLNPRAIVSNLTLFGEYRFEVRSISSSGSRSSSEALGYFTVVNYVASDIYPDPPFPDGKVDGYDLFTLARNWHYIAQDAPNPQADIVSPDRFIEQADLIAFIIQYHGYTMKFPPARPTPTPAPLDAAELVSPAEGASFTLDIASQQVTFIWQAVPHATSYQLFLRNETTQVGDFLTTSNTQFSLTGAGFESILEGGGNCTWEVYAYADGYISSQSERRTFTVNLNYMKSGKATLPNQGRWLESLESFLFGQPAEAGALPAKSVLSGSATILFPFQGQCVTSTSPIPLVWTEVAGATSYAVEIRTSQFYFNVSGYVRDASNLNIITDDVVGDGLVTVGFFSTYRSKDYQIRVQARTEKERGVFSDIRRFEINSVCEQKPFVDIDYSENGEHDGDDLLVYSSFWHTSNKNTDFNERADLAPAKRDGYVDSLDLLTYLNLFPDRKEIPVLMPIDSPLLVSPLDNTFFGPSSIGKDFKFQWTAPTEGMEDFLVWEMELMVPSSTDTVLKKQIFTVDEAYSTKFSLEGNYGWRVRGISTDGTRGRWSTTYGFSIQLEQYQPILPVPISPIQGEMVSGKGIEFEWTRVNRSKLYGIFDRVEIQNGNGPITAVDIYHRYSEFNTPTVKNKIPLSPSFGNQFRWRVKTYFVIRDSFMRLYLSGPIETPEWQTFKLASTSDLPNGVGSWNADFNLDQKIDLLDLSLFSKGWFTMRDSSAAYKTEYDFNRDMRIDEKDMLLFSEAGSHNLLIDSGGYGAPLVNYPYETPGVDPPVYQAANVQGGVRASWGQMSGIKKYLVEWTDSRNLLYGLMADKLSSPTLISPIKDQVVTLTALSPNMTFKWSVVPNAYQYSIVLANLTTGRYDVVYMVDAGSPTDQTISYTLNANEFLNHLGGVGKYEYRVTPFAPGHFADTSVFETFSLAFAKDAEDFYDTVHPITKTKPAWVLDGSAILPAFSYYGLYSWRVMGVLDDYRITLPSKWNRFGIQCLGPAYGYPLYCGQTEPGP